MSGTNHDVLRAVWRQLAQRNGWALVDDESAFLDQVAVELDALTDPGTIRYRQGKAVERAYSRLLYRGLWRRESRAAEELWAAFVRTAIGRGDAPDEAQELAQETIARVLEKLPTLRTPQSLLAWAFTIFHTLRHERRPGPQADRPLEDDAGRLLNMLIDPTDLVAEVEQRQVSQQLQELLAAHLSNDLERTMILRLVLSGEKPRDVAADLKLPLHRTRIAKYRALKRLREDEEFMRILRDLAGNEESGTGDDRSE